MELLLCHLFILPPFILSSLLFSDLPLPLVNALMDPSIIPTSFIFFRPPGYEFVGWKNVSSKPIEVDFSLSEVRAVAEVRLFASEDHGAVSEVRLRCSTEPGASTDFTFSEPIASEAASEGVKVLKLRPEGAPCLGREISLRLFFRGKWLALTEIELESGEGNVKEREQSWNQDVYFSLGYDFLHFLIWTLSVISDCCLTLK